jgi:hypothetical protein
MQNAVNRVLSKVSQFWLVTKNKYNFFLMEVSSPRIPDVAIIKAKVDASELGGHSGSWLEAPV